MTIITAKKIIVNTVTPSDEGERYSYFFAYEFPNGAVMVVGETTNDWFFDSAEEIEPCGSDRVDSVEETEETAEWTVEKLRESIEASESEFDSDAGKIKELI